MLLADMAEVHQALEPKAVTLHSKIIARVPQTDETASSTSSVSKPRRAAC
jgi:hypothetical protein